MQLQDLFQLQPQEYAPLFQRLLVECYQFALANPVNVGLAAIFVWLLTSIFYSIRIAFKNNRIRVLTKAAQDSVTALNAAQAQNLQILAELEHHKEHLQLEQQRNLALQERIAELGGQIAENIVALASRPELGQQGLSVSPGLQPEHLWQRFSAAVKQLGDSLVAAQQNSHQLQEAVSAEAAKLSEKTLQMQALQFRFDSQKQQLLKLETSLEEQQTQFAQQQEAVNLEIAELNARQHAELQRNLELEKRLSQALAVEQPVIKVVEIRQPEPVQPPSAPVVVPAPVVVEQVKLPEPLPAPVKIIENITPAVEIAVVAAAPVQRETAASAVSALGGKFKSLFGSSKAKADKVAEPELQPQAPVTEVITPEPVVEIVAEPVVVAVAKPPLSVETPQKLVVGGKFGGLFANVQQTFAKLDEKLGSSTSKTRQPVSEEPEALIEPVVESVAVVVSEPVVEAVAAPKVLGGFKLPFGLGKKPLPVAEPEPAEQPVVVVEEIVEVVVPEAPQTQKTSQLKGLLGKFGIKG
jgi:peptidoglycan hydrolase CwlO-like protein